MHDLDSTNWLVNNACATVKFRTLIDLLEEPDIGEVGRTFSFLEMDPAIVELVESIPEEISTDLIISRNPHSFENVMGVLFQIGVRAGMQLFDLKTLPYRVWLKDHTNGTPVERQIVTAFLSLTGYDSIMPVSRVLYDRLKKLYKSKDDPSIYELIGFVHSQEIMNNKFQRDWIEEVVFRSLQEAKKIDSKNENDRSLANIISRSRNYPENLLLLLELLAPLWIVQESRWFRTAIKKLDSFRTERGTYLFPESWLEHKEQGFWIHGDYMAMDFHERTKAEIECESTFRALRIRKLSGLL